MPSSLNTDNYLPFEALLEQCVRGFKRLQVSKTRRGPGCEFELSRASYFHFP